MHRALADQETIGEDQWNTIYAVNTNLQSLH